MSLITLLTVAVAVSGGAADGDERGTFELLDLPSVRYLHKSPPCPTPSARLILVHSAPDHLELRTTVRQTWGGEPGFKTVFLLGLTGDELLQRSIDEEASAHGDIVQASFVDSYRNLTYKHILGYRYACSECGEAAFVLKADDDVAVDTLQVERFLRRFIPESRSGGEPFLLCDPVANIKPHRDPSSKWFVTEEEYAGDSYPPFCSGWAYVTNVPFLRAVLAAARGRSPYWIDDVFVTGMLCPAAARVYDWSGNNLRTHAQNTDAVLRGDLFSPQLMVAADLAPAEMRVLHAKFRESLAKGWQESIYGDKQLAEKVRPQLIFHERTLVTETPLQKQEL